MNKWLKELEVIIDKIIPYLVLILLAIIIIDLFYTHTAEKYKFQIGLIDGFIILAFIIDLGFKYNRVRNIPNFVKKYWLEILAVFPFYLIFRLLETTVGFLELSGFIKQGQNIFHSGIEVEKEVSLIGREAGELEKIGSKAEGFSRIFRNMGRTFRAITSEEKELENIKKYYKKKNNRKKNHKK